MLFVLIVAETKSIWRKLRDQRRYKAKKNKNKGKSGAKAPGPDDDSDENMEEEEGAEVHDEMAFLDKNESEQFRQTYSLGGEVVDQVTISDPGSNSVPDECYESPSSSYSYLKENTRDRGDTALKAAHLVGESISMFLKNKENAPPPQLKHMHIWQHLDKLFERLDEDTILDLSHKFVTETYNAVKATRTDI